MGRAYAGVLGPLAFVTLLVRGLIRGWPAESALSAAWLGLVAMALVGLVVGRLAGWIVDDSVRSRMLAEMAAQEEARQAKATTADA